MKNRKFLALLLCLVCVCSVSVSFLIPASASEVYSVYLEPQQSLASYRAYVYNGIGVSVRSASPNTIYESYYEISDDVLDLFENNGDFYATYESLSSSYKVTSAYDNPSHPDNGFLAPIIVNYSLPDGTSMQSPLPLESLASFDIFYQVFFAADEGVLALLRQILDAGGTASIVFQSLTPNPGFYYLSEMPDSEPLYNSAWDLMVKFIYGEGAELTPEQNLTLTLLATIAVLVVVLLPFALVYFVLRFIFGWR